MAVPSLAPSFLFTFLLLLCNLLSVCMVSTVSLEEPESFIVFMLKSKKPRAFSTHHDWYSSIIRTLSPLSNHSSSSELLYTYERVAHGFSARLAPSQASELRNIPGVISVLPDQLHQLQTTRSPQFLGLTDSSGLWPDSDYGADIIVGVLDTGIWPERPSFSDQGLSPKPASWLSKCQVGQDFPATLCNNKIIGARFYYTGYEAVTGRPVEQSGESKSARDMNGHGTHTASTAAGSAVKNASLFGYAQGDARGIATKARIAVYKVCWGAGYCADSDILAGMDQAVADGVDVLSLSIGAPDGGFAGRAREYRQDPVAIGAFGAVEIGVNVVCAAGNYGSGPYTARNIAPWILTVGASTINREFPAVVTLGNKKTFTGTSLYSGVPPSPNLVSVVYGGDASSVYCRSGELDRSKVIATIVFCEPGGNISIVDKGAAVLGAGGYGIIIPNSAPYGFELQANADMIPTSVVTAPDGDIIREYVRSTPLATAKIEFKGTVIGPSPSSPRVAAFSSRGPNFWTPEILKPDKNQVAFLEELAGRTTPKGLHCFSMRLTAEYFALMPEEREFPNQHKLHNPDLYHFAVFSDNILACSVVVNSTISSAKDPEKIVFHIVTDSVSLPAISMWFLLNPPVKATIHIQSIDNIKWLSTKYDANLQKQESLDPRYTSALNHLRFYLPDIFPLLDKLVFLDHDVVVQRDLSALWRINMKGKVNGAVQTCKQGQPSFRRMDAFINFTDPMMPKRFDMETCTWAFGMNLFDLKAWRQRNLTAVYHKYLQLGSKKPLLKAGTLPIGWITFYKHTVALNRSWHVLGLGYDSGVPRGDIEHAAVIHYDGKMKPWLDVGLEKYKPYWRRHVNYEHPHLQQCNIHS